MPQTIQIYEEYWQLTNAFTDYNGEKFLTTLRVCIQFIDQYKIEEYSEEKYKRLQDTLEPHLQINKISIRKAINQLVKLGFINSFLVSYHPDSVEYSKNTTSNKKRESLLSKIVYSNSSFNRAVNRNSDLHQINFLIKTLIENSPLSQEEIIALMLVDISSIQKGYLEKNEILKYVNEAKEIDFISRKYNQIGYLINLLSKLDELKFVDDKLYFQEDAKRIFGEDVFYKETTKKRDPYLHRIYKNQLQEESIELFNKPVCMIEKLDYPVLIASHIKPFIDSNNDEAYDPNNGLLLSRSIDALFDLKYISFNQEGSIIFSSELSDEVKEAWKDYKLDARVLNPTRLTYLLYHNDLLR
ncbi:HNH endonuclease [Sulfurospirillum sp. UCH001]|uniref:HNH endonuclease n=1 Tax=Sulfurospirillum sp. UCH001 TaxID=1581011 RepID=UPI0008362449|nr:HNH endonuclease [Sulfurospirillum sp. UCH001]